MMSARPLGTTYDLTREAKFGIASHLIRVDAFTVSPLCQLRTVKTREVLALICGNHATA